MESLLYYSLLTPVMIPVALFFLFCSWMGFQFFVNN